MGIASIKMNELNGADEKPGWTTLNKINFLGLNRYKVSIMVACML